MEHKNRDDPLVDAHQRHNVGISEYALDILHINFDHQIPNTYEVELEQMESVKKSIDFELRLRKMQLTVIESDQTRVGVVSVGGIFSIALTENITDHHLRGINQKDHGLINSVVDQLQCRGSENSLFEVVLCLDLLRAKDEGLELSGEDNEGVGKERKVADEDVKDFYSTEESSNVR